MIFCSCFFLCSITACKNKEEYVNGRFCVAIASEYKNAFLEQQFTAKDFNIDNEYIEYIRYASWDSEQEVGLIYVQLKESHWNQLDEIIKSVNELNFVTYVEKVPKIYLDPIY